MFIEYTDWDFHAYYDIHVDALHTPTMDKAASISTVKTGFNVLERYMHLTKCFTAHFREGCCCINSGLFVCGSAVVKER